MYVSETELKVRYAETDQMGIVHHSNYFIWFEAGRTDFITFCGMSYQDMEEKGIMLPLVDSYCKYIEGARYSDKVTIHTWIEELTGVKVRFNYSVIRDGDFKELAKGSTTHAFVGKNFKIVNIKKKEPEIWNSLQKLI